jgi:hypothetical protein
VRHRANVLRFRLVSALGRLASSVLIPAAALVAFGFLAIGERARTWARRRRGEKPRLIWGPTPIISLKYWALAMRARGYESITTVSGLYPMHERGDFDRLRSDFLGSSGMSERLRDYAVFAWTLRRGDVFLRFFDGGYLKPTPLSRLELPLLRLAGKTVIASPYGADIAVVGHLGALEEPLLADYPHIREVSDETETQVRHTLKWANLAIMNWQFGFLPSFDVGWPTMLAIDTERWRGPDGDSGADGRGSAVSILHAPNHRGIKGTAELERAVEELRDEGLRIELRVLEGRPNEEIRAAMAACDVVADQVLAGYAMFAVEGMAMGKPVLSNLSSMPEPVRWAGAMRENPIVDTRPERLADDLRRLVEHPEERRRLGRAGREFVLGHHSYEAVADGWEAILSHVWTGAALPSGMVPGGDAAAPAPNQDLRSGRPNIGGRRKAIERTGD